MAFEIQHGMVKVETVQGDLLKADVEAIVNPANSLLIMGGGVAGAIKRAAGVQVEREARRHAPVPVGEAVATSAGNLNFRFVIHAPTMERPAMATTPEKVYRATLAALKCADTHKVKSIAFPGMGTGVGGVPPQAAAEAMVQALKGHVQQGTNLERVVLVGLDSSLVQAFKEAMLKILGSP